MAPSERYTVVSSDGHAGGDIQDYKRYLPGRLHDEFDGVAAEVLFPNTVPPFFEEGNLVALPPTEADYERRWAGLQAHNRWMADFCAKAPDRRAGVVQVFVNRIEDAVAEIRWAREHIRPLGGLLLPSLPPGCGLPPLWEPHY